MQHELHFHPAELNHIVWVERAGFVVEGGAVDDGKATLHMVEKVAFASPRDDRYLHAFFADGREGFGQGNFYPSLFTGKHLEGDVIGVDWVRRRGLGWQRQGRCTVRFYFQR